MTTFMNLDLPVVSETLGPDWATQLNEALEAIDEHDHSSGKGIAITPAGLNINDDLEFEGNRATGLLSAQLEEQSAELTGASNIGSIYNVGGDLYYTNNSGVAVQITDGSSVVTVPADADSFEYSPQGTVTISPSDTFVVVGVDTSSARTVTLPLASAVSPGRLYAVVDRVGSAETNPISIETQGSDTILDEATLEMNSNFGCVFVVGDGVSKWLPI